MQHHDVIQFVLRRPPNSFSYRFFHTYTSTDTLTLASTCTMYNILNAKYFNVDLTMWSEMKSPFRRKNDVFVAGVVIRIHICWNWIELAVCQLCVVSICTKCHRLRAHTVTFVFMHHLVRCFRMINMAFYIGIQKFFGWQI